MHLNTYFKKLAARIADRFGYAIIPQWQLENLPLVEHLRQIFRLCNIDCVIDVGANKGQFGKLIRRQVGFTGPILSFEPVAATFAELKKASHGDSAWQCFNIALGALTDRIPINVTNSDSFSSFLPPRAVSGFVGSNAIISTQECAIERLDEWIEDQGIPYSRCYLKLDTQGFDLNVLQGATGIIDRIPALQTELSFVPIYDSMPDFREIPPWPCRRSCFSAVT